MKKATFYILLLFGVFSNLGAQASKSKKLIKTESSIALKNNAKSKIQKENFKISPNPSKGPITISGNKVKDLKNIKVYNILGSLIKTINLDSNRSLLNLNLSTLNKGIYLVKLNSKNGETTTQKLIIE